MGPLHRKPFVTPFLWFVYFSCLLVQPTLYQVDMTYGFPQNSLSACINRQALLHIKRLALLKSPPRKAIRNEIYHVTRIFTAIITEA